ncbi:pyridoxamine 5'-phosphate oxidase family protein, partial [Micromonospora maritima]
MGLQEAEFDGDLWFFAYADSAKVRQIRVNP